MKRVLLFFYFLFIPILATAQNQWDGDNSVGNFSFCNNWYGDGCPGAGSWNSGTSLQFEYRNNAGQTSLYFDLGWKDVNNILFSNTFGQSTPINGNGNGFNIYGKLENNSFFKQTINVPTSFKGSSVEINAVNADMDVNQTVYNDSDVTINIYGNNSKLLIFNNYIKGSSSVAMNINQYSKVAIAYDMTNRTPAAFSGGVNVNNGEFWINNAGKLNGGTINLGGTNNTSKLFINGNDGKQVSNNVVVRNISGSTQTVGSLNSSGTNEYTGTVTLNQAALFEAQSGGTAKFSGVISGSGTVNKVGLGTVSFTANNTYSGATTVTAGTLNVQKGGHSANITTNAIAFTFASTTLAAGSYNFLPGQLIGTSRTLTSNLVATKSISFDYASGNVIVCDLSTAPTGATGITTICSGGSTSLTVSGGSKGTGASTQWYTGSCGGTLVATGDVLNTGTLTSNTTYYVRYSGNCNTTACAAVTVTVNSSVTIAPFSPATATRCQGAGTVTTTTTASHNTGNIVYSIDSTGAGNSIDSSTGAVTYAAGYSGTTTITATAAGCNGPVSTALAVTVNPLQTPTVVLSSTDSDNTFAYGTSVTFTATASGVSGNTGIVYDFKVDGISRQSGSSNAFTTTAISDQQQVTVSIAVTGGTCMQASTANSNSITNTVSGAVLVHISNYCGQTLPFLTTPIYSSTATVSGNPTVQYQFRVQKVGGASQTLALRSTPSFSLTQTSLYAYNTSFEVYVSAVINGIVQPESAACVITTPAIVPPATVQSTYCGSTLADAYSPIFAAPVPGATGYSFDVFQGSTRISTVVRDVNYFYLSNLPSWTYNTSYTVYVAVKINNEPFGSFGTVPCTVTTPQLSTPGLVACGTQMATVSSPVFTTTVPGATNYAFEITGPGVNGVIVNRSVPYFYLTSITNWNYGTSYTIKVRVTKGSEVGPQSVGCILTTPAIPSTAVRASQCDQLLANAATVIFADPVYGASNYVFKINDGTNPEFSLTRNVNYFSMTSVPTWEYNTVYTVTVQAVRNNSTSPVVTVCSITTPEGPFTTIQDGMCNNPTLTKSGSLTVDAHPNASSYNFFIEQYDENSQVVARYSKVVYTNSLLLSSVPGLPTPTNQEGVTYAWGVQVAVMGKYGEQTKGCSFTLVPTPSGRMAETVFSTTAYPNPFASNFMIDVKTKSQSVVNVKVYDMVGRLIEQRDVKATDLESAAIGNNYPSGVYNVVVAQDDNLETVRVIKR